MLCPVSQSRVSPYYFPCMCIQGQLLFPYLVKIHDMNGCSALHKKFLMLFIRMTAELSSVTSIFLYEVTVFEQLVLSGIHEDCEVIITSPIPVMLPSLERNCNCSGLWGKNKTKPDPSKAEETKKREFS